MFKATQHSPVRDVSPREAKELLEFNTFPGQREYNALKGRRYADQMEAGTMRPVDIAIATLPDGRKVLMNGQHVCNGIMLFGKPYKAVVSHWKCETEADAWRLYATFDVHASRTQNQIFKGARGRFKDERLNDVPLRILSCSGSALLIIGDKGKPQFSRHSVQDKTVKVDVVDNHAEEVLWLGTFKDHRHMVRVGTFAAMLTTRRKSTKNAEEFWRWVADGLGMKSKNDPAYKLRERLHANSFGVNTRDSHFVLYATCISWWNSFITVRDRAGSVIYSRARPLLNNPRITPKQLYLYNFAGIHY